MNERFQEWNFACRVSFKSVRRQIYEMGETDGEIFEGIGRGKKVRRIHSGVENRCSVGRVTPSSSEGM